MIVSYKKKKGFLLQYSKITFFNVCNEFEFNIKWNMHFECQWTNENLLIILVYGFYGIFIGTRNILSRNDTQTQELVHWNVSSVTKYTRNLMHSTCITYISNYKRKGQYKLQKDYFF